MAITFPTTLDTLNNPAATDKEDASGVFHDVQHSDANDAIEAIEAKVGVNDSAVTSSLDYRLRNLEYPSATGGEDDDFNDASFSGWTTVEGGGVTLTVTESLGRCSVVHSGGGSAGHFVARMKAHTFSTNDWIECAVRGIGVNQNHDMFGLTMSNGTTHGTSNAVHWLVYLNTSGFRYEGNNGFTADTAQANVAAPAGISPFGDVFLRWKYEGSNTFRGYASCDGISWIDFTGTKTYTLTPTHVGFSATSWGGSLKHMFSLAYFKVGNG